MKRKCHKLCEDEYINEHKTAPIVYTGMQNQKTVIIFNDYFNNKTITNLINDIESIRQIGGYEIIDLYFSSLGGETDTLFILADYLNGIQGIKINFRVNGMVASCGFDILLLINNNNINLTFNQHCSGLIHLGDTWLSARSQLTTEEGRYNLEKFRAEDLKKLNEYFKNEIISNLNLSKKDIKKLNEGGDVILHAKELKEIVTKYHECKYFNSEESISDYVSIQEDISELLSLAIDFKEKFKRYAKIDIDKELGIEVEEQ